MYKSVIFLSLFFALNGIKAIGQNKRTLKNPIVLFNNSMNGKNLPTLTYQEQAIFIKKLGFDGMEYKEPKGFLQTIDTFNLQGLKMITNYSKFDLDAKDFYLQEWKQVIPKLKGKNVIIEFPIYSTKYKPSDEAADSIMVPVFQELADFAKPYGVRLAVYPHINLLAEKVEDSYRIAKKVNRSNFGTVFNLCHFLSTDSTANLQNVLTMVQPNLFAVSISGADDGETKKWFKESGWDHLILPLGKGSLDVYRVVEFLAEKGYDGPIGIQCFKLKDKPEVYLQQSSEEIKSFKQRYSVPLNTLTNEEKKEGWKLLFNGKNTNLWRGINTTQFPSSGWKIENNELIAFAHGGAESDNGGDIITKKQYGEFILKWEWRMETKGGNSGVKYFVQEGLGSNKGYGYGLEYQILDDKYHPWMLEGKMKPNDYHTMGSLYEIYPASEEKQASPLGLWNESMIVCKGYTVEHWLNGKLILKYNRNSDDFKAKIATSKFKDIPNFGVNAKGHILLQDHGSIIHYRNLKIKDLELQK
jgi:sugar phosphate isomerase/epimerase